MIEDPIDRVEEPAYEPGPDDEVHWVSYDLSGGGYLAQCLGCGWHADERREVLALAEGDGDTHLIQKDLDASWDLWMAETYRMAEDARLRLIPLAPQPDPLPALRAEFDDNMTRTDRIAVWGFVFCLAFTCIALGLSLALWAQWVAFGVGWGIGALVGCRRHKVATDRARSRRVQALLDPYGGGHVSDIGRQWS